MNRIFLTAVIVASWALSASSAVLAQHRVNLPALPVSTKPMLDIAPVKPAATGTTRVAVINLGYILNKYDRANALKDEIQVEVKKAQEEAKKLMESTNLWQQALQKNEFKNGTKEQYEEKLINSRRRLEDLNRQMGAKLNKATQTQLLTLWNDIQEAVKTYSAQHGIDLVMACGEPIQKDLIANFQNVTRKMQASDNGAAVPFFMAPGVDISEAITDLLNERYREAKERDDN